MDVRIYVKTNMEGNLLTVINVSGTSLRGQKAINESVADGDIFKAKIYTDQVTKEIHISLEEQDNSLEEYLSRTKRGRELIKQYNIIKGESE